jgi:hypothetical protein
MSRVHDAIAAKIDEWQALRLALAEMERREHPDIADVHGRVWTWRGGNGDEALYSHDATLAFPRSFVTNPRLGLPKVGCEDNPNYARLCSLCRADWPTAQLELFQVRWVRTAQGTVQGTPIHA